MRVLQGKSFATDAEEAVAEATHGWTAGDRPEVLFCFVSTKQDADGVAKRLAEAFPDTIVVGCTTTGEHLSGEHFRGAMVLTALCETGIRWSTTSVAGLAGFDAARAGAAARALYDGVGADTEELDPHEYVCVSFIDGLRGAEEAVTAHLAEALEGARLVGGSAGDDLAFAETKVIAGGRAHTDAAVLLMGRGKGRFEIIKHQHFARTRTRLAVTKVDAAHRRVLELDGRPALDAYASALGLPPADVTGDVTFLHPVTLSCNGEQFIRSIQRVHEDGSITFYCGVEEGVVLEIAAHGDLVAELGADLARRTDERGAFDFMLGCNCILRALEADKYRIVEAAGDVWRRSARTAIGFDTYGEQLDGLHINQTLVAVGIRGAA